MAEYIEREAAMNAITDFFKPVVTIEDALMLNHLLKKLDLPPAADVAPVVHARWEKVRGNVWACSHCGAETASDNADCSPVFSAANEEFCYRCGAKMDLED